MVQTKILEEIVQNNVKINGTKSYEKGVLQKKKVQVSLGQRIKGTGRVGRRHGR